MKFAKRKIADKAAAATAIAGARQSLSESTTSARDAAVAALANLSPALVQLNPEGTITPAGLLKLSFDDPRVGLDDAEMAGFFASISTAINDSRVAALIDAKLAGSDASVNIGDVAKLIQLWIDNPGIAA